MMTTSLLARRVRLGLWVVAGLFVVNDTLVSVVMVRDDGMHPTIKKGDLVVVDRLALRPPRSGQIVLLRNPEADRGATELRLLRRVDYQPDVRYSKFRFVKDNKDGEARDSKDFGPVPDGVILGKAVAIAFPPWRINWLTDALLWRVNDT